MTKVISFNETLSKQVNKKLLTCLSRTYILSTQLTLDTNFISLNSLPFDLPNNVFCICDDVCKGLFRLHLNIGSVGLDGLSGEFFFNYVQS